MKKIKKSYLKCKKLKIIAPMMRWNVTNSDSDKRQKSRADWHFGRADIKIVYWLIIDMSVLICWHCGVVNCSIKWFTGCILMYNFLVFVIFSLLFRIHCCCDSEVFLLWNIQPRHVFITINQFSGYLPKTSKHFPANISLLNYSQILMSALAGS